MSEPATSLALPLFGQAIGQGLSGAGGRSDAMSTGSMGGSMFDASGWNVAFGNSKLEADQKKSQPMDKTFMYVAIGVGALLIFKYLKVKK